MSDPIDLAVNLPGPLAEMREAFAAYERALTENDVALLDLLFWNSPLTLRYGVAENLYGWDAIAAFRAGRSPAGLARSLRNTVITTFGTAAATANTEFVREGSSRTGRQSQSWIRFPASEVGAAFRGWRIVAAHVSLLAGPD
jgi:hypothetical protein